MALLDFLFGQKAKTQKFPTMNQGQQNLLSQLLSQINPQSFNLEQNPNYQAGSSYLQKLLSGEEGAFEDFEQPYKRQFEEETIPGLAERFSGLGAQKSSAFGQQAAQAGAGLSEKLASLRAELQQGAAGQALGYAQAPGQMGLQTAGLGLGAQPFAYGQRQGSTGLIGQLLAALGQGAGQYGGMKFGKSLFG